MNEIELEKERLKLSKIDVLSRTLGLMVMIPEYESDPNNIGSKVFKGTIQQPILLEQYRKDGLTKLNELIKSL